jgi:hypothetical protein
VDSDNSDSLLILVGMFDDYEKSVIAFYEARKANRMLSPLLSNLTPAKLKKECKVVCEERYDRKDDWTLRAFFEQGGDKKTCLHAINQCDIDIFRPLINFLAGRARSTGETNIELLAWLIDFKPRPYDDKYDYGNWKNPNVPAEVTKGKSGDAADGTDAGVDEPVPGPVEPVKRSFDFGLGEGIIVITILVAIIVGVRFCTGPAKRPADMVLTGHGACMFWDDDHYEPTSCSPKSGDTAVIALDPGKLNHFRKITRRDTITEASAGKVWYVKYNRDVEFYTDSGYHPLDPRLRLRPATVHMIRTYCHSGQ